MAISKEKKNQLLAQYCDLMKKSRTVILTEYTGMTMKDLDELRTRLREVGAEFHISKNTLTKLAFKEIGVDFPDELLTGSTAIGFGFEDAPATAKAISEYVEKSSFMKIKAGVLGTQFVSSSEIKALAELPPLPILRAQILGTIMAPASKLVRTLAEPGRQIAAVIKAKSETENIAI